MDFTKGLVMCEAGFREEKGLDPTVLHPSSSAFHATQLWGSEKLPALGPSSAGETPHPLSPFLAALALAAPSEHREYPELP